MGFHIHQHVHWKHFNWRHKLNGVNQIFKTSIKNRTGKVQRKYSLSLFLCYLGHFAIKNP